MNRACNGMVRVAESGLLRVRTGRKPLLPQDVDSEGHRNLVLGLLISLVRNNQLERDPLVLAVLWWTLRLIPTTLGTMASAGEVVRPRRLLRGPLTA